MSRAANTWSCSRCGTAAFAEQKFCRKCGTPRRRGDAPITEQVAVAAGDAGPGSDQSMRSSRPFSRLALASIALLFVVIGGLGAIIFNNIHGDESNDPTVNTKPSTSTTVLETTTTKAATTTTTSTTTTTTTVAASTTTPTTVAAPTTTGAAATPAATTTPPG